MNRFEFSLHKNLLIALVKRDITARYRGSWLGLMWSVLNPVLLLLVYYFVFTHVFKARLPQLYDGRDIAFSGFIFSGLIVYFLFSEVLTRAPSIIQDNANYVKKVVFPLEIIPLVTVLSAAFNFCIAFVVLQGFLLVSGEGLKLASLVFPLIALPYLLFLLGIAWFVSALAVYIRDVTYVVGFIATAMMFLSPVFYPPEIVPESFRVLMFYNPLTYFIESFRMSVVAGVIPPADFMLIPAAIGTTVCAAGYAFFQRVRSGFADII